jgi:hypothetical protein
MYLSGLSLSLFALVSLVTLLPVHAQTYTATYSSDNLPDRTEDGQTGTNKCGTGSNQTSSCQNAYSPSQILLVAFRLFIDASWVPVNSVDDFCLFAPPEPGPGSDVGNVEVGHPSNPMPFPLTFPTHSPAQEIVVSWCAKVCCALGTLSTSLTLVIWQVWIRDSCHPPRINQRSSLRPDARLRSDNGYR